MFSRRKLLVSSAAGAVGSTLLGRRLAAQPPGASPAHAHLAAARRSNGGVTPVITPNGASLPYRMENGVKVFHLTAEPVKRNFLDPGPDGAGRLHRELLGLQRHDPRPDHRGLRGRPRAHLRHEQAARGDVDPLARLHPAQRHGRRERSHPAEDRAGGDVRLRVHAEAERHADVPPAFRRDDADRAGDARLLRHPSPRRRTPPRRSRLRHLPQRVVHQAGHGHARSDGDARLQRLHVQQPCLSGHRPHARAHGRSRAHPPRQSDDGLAPHAHSRAPLLRHRHGRRSHPGVGLDS